MSFSEDMSQFINSDTPGYALASVGGVVMDTLFDPTYQEVFGAAGTHPMLILASSVATPEGTVVVIGAKTYIVAESILDDGFEKHIKLEDAA